MIQVRQISKHFGAGAAKVRVLSDISFSLETGKMLTVIGKSGSGKTTLLNCLGGLDVPDSGIIECFGIQVNGLSEKKRSLFQRKHLGVVFQSNNLLSYLTVFDNIVFPLVLNGSGKKERENRVTQLLEILGLEQAVNAMPHELSGGQAQRIAFARAIAHSPQLLLADEPTANLDTQTGLNLIKLMIRVGMEENTTIIVSTHDKGILEFSDETLYLSDGEIRSDGKTKGE